MPTDAEIKEIELRVQALEEGQHNLMRSLDGIKEEVTATRKRGVRILKSQKRLEAKVDKAITWPKIQTLAAGIMSILVLWQTLATHFHW